MENNINEAWDSICRIMKEVDEIYHKIATYYNLSDSSLWVLYVLYQKIEGCTQKELSTDWYMNKQTINSSIKYLKNKEYIALNYEQNNKKFKIITLTEKGRELADKTVKKVIEIEKRVFENVDEKEMSIVLNFLRNKLRIFKEETQKEIGI